MKMKEILEIIKTSCNSLHKLVLTIIRIVKTWLVLTGQVQVGRKKSEKVPGFWGTREVSYW